MDGSFDEAFDAAAASFRGNNAEPAEWGEPEELTDAAAPQPIPQEHLPPGVASAVAE